MRSNCFSNENVYCANFSGVQYREIEGWNNKIIICVGHIPDKIDLLAI